MTAAWFSSPGHWHLDTAWYWHMLLSTTLDYYNKGQLNIYIYCCTCVIFGIIVHIRSISWYMMLLRIPTNYLLGINIHYYWESNLYYTKNIVVLWCIKGNMWLDLGKPFQIAQWKLWDNWFKDFKLLKLVAKDYEHTNKTYTLHFAWEVP